MNPMEMAVKLLGDASSFVGMIKEAQGTLSQVVDAVQSAASKIEEIGDTLKGFFSSAVEGLASLDIQGRMREWFGLYMEQEQAEFRLRAALKFTGQEVENNFQMLSEYADVLQETTIHGNEHSIALMQEAISSGLSARAAMHAVRNALALADAKKIGVEAALKLTIALQRGRTQGLQPYFETLRKIKDPVQKVAYAQKQLNEIFEVAKEIANTTSGKINQLNDAVDNLKEGLGAVVAEALQPFLDPAKDFINWVAEVSPEIKKLVVVLAAVYSTLLLIGPAFALLKVLGFAFFNPFTILVTLATTLTLAWVQSVGSVPEAWKKVREVVEPALGKLWDWLKKAYDATVEFVKAHRESVTVMATAALGIAGTVLAYKSLITAIAMVSQVLTFLKVQQVVLISLWVLWKATLILSKLVLLSYTGIVWLVTASLGALKAMFLTVAAGQAMFSVATVAGTVTTAIFNAVVLTLTFSLKALLVILIAIPIYFGAITIAVMAVAGVIGGALGAATALFAVFDRMPQLAGPLKDVGDVLGDWWSLLKKIYRAMTVDMGLAWRFIAAGADLAIAEVKALFPPLWQFIKAGSVAIFTLISNEFVNKFQDAALTAGERMLEMMDIFGMVTSKMRGDLQALHDKSASQTIGNIQKAEKALKDALEAFEWEESEDMIMAMFEIILLTEELEKKEKEAQKDKQDGQDKYNDGLEQEYQLKQALKMQNASLYQSAEALAKVTQYREQLLYGAGGGFYQGRPVAPLGAEAVRAHAEHIENVKRMKMEGGKGFVPVAPGALVPTPAVFPVVPPAPGAGPMVPVPGGGGGMEDNRYKNTVVGHLANAVKLLADIAKKPVPALPPADLKP